MAITAPDILHRELTEKIIGVYHETRHELGIGFLERVSRRAVVIVLRDAGLQVEEEVPMPVYFRGHLIGEFYADIVVNGLVLVEAKACAALEPRHRAQIINYLRASKLEVGLLLNFGPKSEFERFVYSNDRKTRQAR